MSDRAHRKQVLTVLTLLGVLADLAYFMMCVGAMLARDGQWAPALVWSGSGAAWIAWLSTIAWRRVKAVLRAR
jgi:hypothetical protein